MMRTNLPPSPLFWNRILCIGLIAMPVMFYHFTLVLTETIDQNKKLQFGYVSGGVLLLFNFTGQIMADAYIQNNVFYYKLGPFASVMAIWSIGYLVLAFTNIIQKVKSDKIPYARVKYILFGLIIVIVGGLLNLSPRLGKYPFDIILNTVNAMFIAYSIYRYRFLEIKLIVKKGLAYSVYTLILSGAYIIAIFAVQNVLSRIIGYTNLALTLAKAVLLALMFQPVKNLLQHGIDRLFYKEKLSHQKLLKEFSQISNNVFALNELIEAMVRIIGQGLKCTKISLVFKQGKDEYSLFHESTTEKYLQEIRYGSNHPIIQWFAQGKALLSIDEIDSLPFFTGLWSMEKKQLHDLGTEIIVPVNLREQLIGLLILSEKKDGEAYSEAEMDFMATLMNNAAVVIENAKLYEEAKHQAITDGLTKLYNHRYFHEILGDYVHNKRCDVFSLAIIDVDLFKIYNDLYGHSAGDKALAKISEVLRQTTRSEDIIARYGGEEFAIIFPHIEGAESLKAIETIRRAVENSFFSSNQINEFLTISVGVASYPKDGKTTEEILECADSAMYIAKRSGRNQCVLYASTGGKSSVNSDEKEIESIQDSIKSAYFSAIYALAATIDAKDHYTYGHSENVARYAVALAQAAGFDSEKVETVRNAGLLHDIGKIGIPERILTKMESLLLEEYEIMKRHVDISISIIKHVPSLIKVIPAIMSHHERYDGTGYPRGMKGENIPIEGRCLCIVDAFDAMTTDRPYRKALEIEAALHEIRKHKGTQFDPDLADIFIQLFENGEIKVA